MRQSIIFFVMVVVLSFSITAVAMSPKAAMKSLKKHYDEVETFQADFRELFEWGMTGETVIREGTLTIIQPNRFRIETDEQLMVSDGEAIYRHNKISAQVIVEPVKDNDEALLPQRLLLNFSKEFNAESVSDMQVAMQAGFRLELSPKERETGMVDKITIWATTEDMTIRRLKISDMNGNSTTYFLTDISMNKPIDASVTTFTVPDGVELFDLR